MRQTICILAITLWLPFAYAEPEIVVIANNRSDLGALTRKQITDIYLGRISTLPNNSNPLPLDYQGDSPLRTRFYESLTGKSMAQINAYWARLSFTGQGRLPLRLPDQSAVLHSVEKNPSAIGYVNTSPSGRATTLITLE